MLGLGDHDRAPAEAGKPVPLAGVVALDAVGLFLADMELPLRDQPGTGLPAVRAVEPRVPARLHPGDQTLQGSSVATAQLPVDEPARGPVPSFPDPELVGLFFR